jgi:hypothetical protein
MCQSVFLPLLAGFECTEDLQEKRKLNVSSISLPQRRKLSLAIFVECLGMAL